MKLLLLFLISPLLAFSQLRIDDVGDGWKGLVEQALKVIEDTDTAKYITSKFGEDFEGFKSQLAVTTTISEADKNFFIRVLEMTSDPKQRETEMINLGKSYTELEKDVFPAIRRTSIKVNYTLAGMTDDELKYHKKLTSDTALSHLADFAKNNPHIRTLTYQVDDTEQGRSNDAAYQRKYVPYLKDKHDVDLVRVEKNPLREPNEEI